MPKDNVVHYEAAGGVVVDQGRMLLLARPSRNEIRLPKGHIDPGETAQGAALREVTEESGYTDLEIVGDMGSEEVEFTFDGKQIVRSEHYFLMQLLSDEVVERDAKDRAQFHILWVALADAPAQLTYPAEASRARAAIEMLRRT